MFEVAELGHKVSKEKFDQRVPPLRTELLEIQQKLLQADFPVFVLISGVDGGGKGEVINTLNEWMDPRYVRTHAFGAASEEERERPGYWRYWMSHPEKGRVGIYVGSWYSEPISRRVSGASHQSEMDAALLHVNELEKELSDDGALIIKCWIHLSEKKQKQRLKALEKNPQTRWRVSKRDHKHLKSFERFVSIAERALRETSTGYAPWLIIDGSDIKYTTLTVGEHLLSRINDQLELRSRGKPVAVKAKEDASKEMSVLESLDLSMTYTKKEYNKQLEKYQGKLNILAREARKKKVSSILIFEGWDAAGKGGVIRRIIHALDARQYRVIPIAAPTDEEKAHHYLWRFWRHLPRAGQITIYDRSWYGRVLVERVEGFATQAEWMRAYAEINDFEEELTEHGIALAKFWIHIDADEQLRRFKEREKIAYKQFKITEEDYRNRERWADYEVAVNDIVTRTSTEYAPWHLIEGNDKRYARVKALETFCKTLEKVI